MSLLRNMTIRHKLTAIIMVTSVSALTLVTGAYALREWNGIRSNTLSKLSSHAAVMAESCKAALTFEDAGYAQKLLSALDAESSISYACVFTKEGEVLATHLRSSDQSGPEIVPTLEEGYHFGGTVLDIVKGIDLDGETIGTLFIRADISDLYAKLSQNFRIGGLAVLAVILATYLVSSRLQRIISDPILYLASSAEFVSESKDFSLRVRQRGNDEVGQLVKAFNVMLEQVEERDALLTHTNKGLADQTAALTREIAERKQKEVELKDMQKDLISASHRAGMAEVATDVLHNVGNVLNSVNVSTNYIKEKLATSKTTNLGKVVGLMDSHSEDLRAFLSEDKKGKLIPKYLRELVKLIELEQEDVTDKLLSLKKNVDHIKDIVQTQQSYARAGGVLICLDIHEVIRDAIGVNATALERQGVQVVSEFEELPEVFIDKQRVLQILVNLIRNGREALSENDDREQRLTVSCHRHGDHRLFIQVADNGMGITNENLTKVFSHGFTTKKEGHGFGLHSGALAAQEMGGSLTVHSEGPGCGTTFTLELPFRTEGAKA